MRENSQKFLIITALYVFCWYGLGLPFIWLRSVHPEASQIYQTTQKVLPLLLLIAFSIPILLNFKKALSFVFNSKLAVIFVLYVTITLIWTPIGGFEKLLLFFSITLCSAAAISSLLTLGWQRTWSTIMVSLAAYVFATLACSQAGPHQPLLNIVIVYALAFLGGLILVFIQNIESGPPSKIYKFALLTVLLISVVAVLLPLLGDSTPDPELSQSRGWIPYRLDFGIFINPNLHSRLLQVLLLATVVTGTLFAGDYKFKKIALFSSIIIIVSFLILQHQAANGKVVFAGVLCAIIVGTLLRYIGINKPELFKPTAKHFVFLTLLVGIVTLALWMSGQFDNSTSELAAVFDRADFKSRFRIWKTSISLLNIEQLMFGVGLGGFWNGEFKLARLDPYLDPIAHAHNGFVDIILQTGFVSLIFLILAVYRSGSQSFIMSAKNSTRENWLRLTWFLAISGLLMMNIFESVLLPTTSATMLPFSILLLVLFNPQREKI